jgi:Na+-transporting NADH:ubiquinone oxidoreductase subunit NqrB
MDIKALQRIERMNYILGAIMIAVASILGTWEQSLGVLVGVGISCANFSLMVRMVKGWLQRARGQRSAKAFFMLPKMVSLLGIVFLALYFLPISAPAFGLGFSVFVISITVETIRMAVQPPVNGNAGTEE